MLRNNSACTFLTNRSEITAPTTGIQPSLELWHIYVTFLIIGVLSTLVAKGFNVIRSHVYNDKVSRARVAWGIYVTMYNIMIR